MKELPQEGPFRSSVLGQVNTNVVITALGSSYYYIPIPKNASSYTFKFFRNPSLKWKYYELDNFQEVNDKVPIILLRDPLERWCSGFAQDCTFYNLKFNFNDKSVLDDIFTKFSIGYHSLPQTYYLKDFNLTKAIFIKIDNLLINKLQHLVENKFKVDNFFNFEKFRKESNMSYQIKWKLQKTLENPKYELKLKTYLESDYKLYNNCSFYNG